MPTVLSCWASSARSQALSAVCWERVACLGSFIPIRFQNALISPYAASCSATEVASHSGALTGPGGGLGGGLPGAGALALCSLVIMLAWPRGAWGAPSGRTVVRYCQSGCRPFPPNPYSAVLVMRAVNLSTTLLLSW